MGPIGMNGGIIKWLFIFLGVIPIVFAVPMAVFSENTGIEGTPHSQTVRMQAFQRLAQLLDKKKKKSDDDLLSGEPVKDAGKSKKAGKKEDIKVSQDKEMITI